MCLSVLDEVVSPQDVDLLVDVRQREHLVVLVEGHRVSVGSRGGPCGTPRRARSHTPCARQPGTPVLDRPRADRRSAGYTSRSVRTASLSAAQQGVSGSGTSPCASSSGLVGSGLAGGRRFDSDGWLSERPRVAWHAVQGACSRDLAPWWPADSFLPQPQACGVPARPKATASGDVSEAKTRACTGIHGVESILVGYRAGGGREARS